MVGNNSLSIFFPCYNDARTISSLVIEADKIASELTDNYEIIVIDDYSNDDSKEVLKELSKKYNHLHVIMHKVNKGYGGVLKSGFSSACKNLVFYTDGDGQYDVGELKILYKAMREGIDVVNGYKIERNDPFYRILIGKIYLCLMRLLFNFRIRDVDCDFRLIRKEALREITLIHDSGVICLELIKKLENKNCVFAEVPVHHYFRTYGKSQFFNFRRLFKTGIEILVLWKELRLK